MSFKKWFVNLCTFPTPEYPKIVSVKVEFEVKTYVREYRLIDGTIFVTKPFDDDYYHYSTINYIIFNNSDGYITSENDTLYSPKHVISYKELLIKTETRYRYEEKTIYEGSQ